MNRAFRSLDAAAHVLNGDLRKRRRRGCSSGTILIRSSALYTAAGTSASRSRGSRTVRSLIPLASCARAARARVYARRNVIKHRRIGTDNDVARHSTTCKPCPVFLRHCFAMTIRYLYGAVSRCGFDSAARKCTARARNKTLKTRRLFYRSCSTRREDKMLGINGRRDLARALR